MSEMQASGSADEAFDRLLKALDVEYGEDVQLCLLVLDADVTPPLDVQGFRGGIRLDAEPWVNRPVKDALDFAARVA